MRRLDVVQKEFVAHQDQRMILRQEIATNPLHQIIEPASCQTDIEPGEEGRTLDANKAAQPPNGTFPESSQLNFR